MRVKLSNTCNTVSQIITAAANGKVTPLQANILLALSNDVTGMEVSDLISYVRKSNPTSYKFVLDKAFFNTVVVLHNKGMVTYS